MNLPNGPNPLAGANKKQIDEIAEGKLTDPYDRFFTLSLDLFCIASFDGYFKRLNPAWRKTLGFTEEELLAKPCLDFVHPDDHELTIAEAQKLADGMNTISLENRYLCKDGSYRWLLWSATPVVEQQLIYATARDITKRKWTEELLRASEEKWRSLVENTPDIIMTVDCDGVILSINRTIPGVTVKEAVGAKIYDYIPSVYYKPLKKILRQVFQTGKSDSYEVDGVESHGRTSCYASYVGPIKRNGQVTAAMLISRDVTGRKQIDAALRENEKRYRQLVEEASDVVYTTDPQGYFTYVNPPGQRLTGYPDHKLIGMHFANLIAEGWKEQAKSIYTEQSLKQSRETSLELPIITRFGKTKWIEQTVTPLIDGDCVTGLHSIARDITERKQIEQMKDEFVSTVSHELRTPLTSISGSLGLIAGGVVGELPVQVKMMIDIAHRNSERLVCLINDILDIEKIESGNMVFNLEPVKLMPLMEQAIETNCAYAEQFGVEFVIVAPSPGVKVNVDSNRLMQVFTNLLSNAAKFSMPHDEVNISILCHGEVVRVAVTDHGPGIPEEFRPRIFEKFAQADSADNRQKEGTGLGLSICKSIIEKFGGHIDFETETNVGTTFYFDLPEWYAEEHTKDNNTDTR